MKKILLYSSLILLALTSGCAPATVAPNTSANGVPSGTFTGEFRLTHTNSKTGAKDSLTANIQLQMETATGFKVTGDTSTVHAGSFGSYFVNTSNYTIEFIDNTFPASGTPAKAHLDGVYDYILNGTNLQMVTYGTKDTISYYYNLNRTGN